MEEKFVKMYETYADAIFRHCYFSVLNKEQAKDLAQETFVKTWHYIAKGNKIDNEKAFLYKVATNLMINLSRKKKESSLEVLQDKGFDPGFDNRESLNNFLAGKKALEELGEIDDKYSQAVVMRYIDDLSPEEIANITGESANTVSVHIHRGLKKLKELME
ncbi:MAG: RNA polymerase sigma factor [bacterium]|nr:RNA polymerase sigma factor [bacterium]